MGINRKPFLSRVSGKRQKKALVSVGGCICSKWPMSPMILEVRSHPKEARNDATCSKEHTVIFDIVRKHNTVFYSIFRYTHELPDVVSPIVTARARYHNRDMLLEHQHSHHTGCHTGTHETQADTVRNFNTWLDEARTG